MHARSRRYAGIVLGILATALAAASLAWACSPEAVIGLTPQSAAPGATVTVTGEQFVEGDTVQLRWNAADGRVLATVSPRGRPGAEFRTTITVPRVPADTYSVIAVARDPNGNGRTFTARAALTVGSPGSQRGPGDRAGAADNRLTTSGGGDVSRAESGSPADPGAPRSGGGSSAPAAGGDLSPTASA